MNKDGKVKFHGTAEELMAIVRREGFEGTWKFGYKRKNLWNFHCNDGSILSFWFKTGAILFSGYCCKHNINSKCSDFADALLRYFKIEYD